MAPGGKRKRGDARIYGGDDDHSSRPSPHRPQNLALAHAQQTSSPRGGRRASRNSGRGGSSAPQSPSVTQGSPSTMLPPPSALQTSKPIQANPPPPMSIREPAFTYEVPNSNDHLTPERVANWNGDARNAIVQAAITAQRDGDIFNLAIVFHEIIQACMEKSMDPKELGTIVRDIVNAPSDDLVDPASTFLDTLSSLTEDDAEYAQLRQMLVATDIDVATMRKELESKMLINLELVRPTFARVAVRKATNALYRQTNYNLLREESEGFSKLITEYFTTVNNEPPTRDVVSNTYRRVNGFIGAFDLDVGRVLDVTLDVFANLLVKHGRFFVKYLRISAWWPELQGMDDVRWEEPEIQTLPSWALPESQAWYYTDQEKEERFRLREQRDHKFWKRVAELGDRAGIKAFFELGTRRITANIKDTKAKESEDQLDPAKQTATQKWIDEWIAATGTLPPQGNDIAAQLLGFKLRFYASDARDAHDFLPDNLIYLAALLIKIGFISLMDLYPHLYPADEDMSAHREKLEKEKKEKVAKRRGKAMNALAMAGALPDDTLPPPAVARLRETEGRPSAKPESERSTSAKSDDEAKEVLPEPADQKVALLRSLLCIGALPEALFILGRYPWLLDVYPDLHTYIFRVAHHSFTKVYEASRPVSPDKIPCVAKGAITKSLQQPGDFAPRRILRWAKPDQKDAGDGIDYRFYWEDWVDNVPICQDVDDVFRLCSTLLALVGPECGRDITLMTKLARIGRRSVIENPSSDNLKRWSDFSATFLAPALTFTGQNPGVVNEMWELFRRFDTGTRYMIYSHWFQSTKPVMRTAFKEVQDDTRDLLGKISATNTRPMGRAMAKLACACPGIVFQQTLKQGQSYINMIDALVECSRYLTSLGYDCLTWALVNTFTTNDRPTLQGDGMLTKPWLKNTAIFIGKVYRRFSLMDPTPVLQFITHQLLRPTGELYMLTVLEQLIVSMAGIGLSGALTEARVLALSAGPNLRSYTLEHHLGDHRHQAKAPARRLLRCLKETGLTSQILIALARQVETYLFREELDEVPDKVVFTNYDNLRSSFVQFLELLREYLAPEEFNDIIPGLVDLISEFHVEPSLAFHISRDSISAKVNSARTGNGSLRNRSLDGDVTMGGNNIAPLSNSIVDKTEDVEMKDAGANDLVKVQDSSAVGTPLPNGTSDIVQADLGRSNPEIEILVNQLKSALPEQYANHSCLNFFVTFWQLSLKDVYDPRGAVLKKQYDDCKSYFISKANPPISDRRNMSQDTASLRQAKKLEEEYEDLTRMAEYTQSALRREMQHWFDDIPMVDQLSDKLHGTLLQDCFLPRVRMSLDDAQFSSTMLLFMHGSGVPGFRTAKLLDQLFNANKLGCIIMMSSEEESKCFGRFVNDVLRELQRWHDDKNAYEKFAHGESKQLPGFGRSWNADRTPSQLISYEDFRHLLYKWHRGLFLALKHCLSGGQYTELRNAINILKALSPTFPKVDTMAKELRQIVEHHAKDDDRDDVKVAANSLLFEFKRSAKLWKSEVAFKQGQEAAKANIGSLQTTSEPQKASSSQDTGTKKLNATAPTFQPKVPEVNGLPKALTVTNEDVERKQSGPPAATGVNAGPRPNGRETYKPTPTAKDSGTPTQPRAGDNSKGSGPALPSAPDTSIPNRPDSRGGAPHPPSNRTAHNLPTRPDAQPPRPRPIERSGERQADYNSLNRHEARGNLPTHEYGRSDRLNDPPRDREVSPNRRPHPRTPDRLSVPTERRDRPMRDARELDDRLPRPVPRDVRGPSGRANAWADGTRDPRDPREGHNYRERESIREPPRELLREPPRDHLRDPSRPLPRDAPRESPRESFRQPHRETLREPPREPLRPPHREPPREVLREPPRERVDGRGPPPVPSAPLDSRNRMHPGSLASTDDRRRDQAANSHREDRNTIPPPRPQTNGGPTNNEGPRLNPERAAFINDSRGRGEQSRSDRDVPTGPRGGRADPMTSRGPSRDMFQPSQSRPTTYHTQDPNYGRLNPPTETIPSGPRGSVQTPPTAPAAAQPGIHPDRLRNIDVAGAPSGPRGSTRSQPNALRTINNVLAQNTPPERPPERSHRRSDRSGRERSRSPDRRSDTQDRRQDAPDRRQEGLERRPDERERERERNPRDRRDRREREPRDPREVREPREPRETRDRDRERDDRRESGRKRVRDPTDQAHGDQKRSRRSN